MPAALGLEFLALEAKDCSLTRNWTQLVCVVRQETDCAGSRLVYIPVSGAMSYGLRVVDPKPAVGGSVTLQLFGNRNVKELRQR